MAVYDDSLNTIDEISLTVTQDTGVPNSDPFGYFIIDLGTIPIEASSFSLKNRFISSSFTNNTSIPYGVSSVTFDTIKPELVNDKFTSLGPDNVITGFNPIPCDDTTEGTLTILATFQNISSDTMKDLFFEIVTLTGDNVLCNSNGGTGDKGSTLRVSLEEPPNNSFDGLLLPGEYFNVEFNIGLSKENPFTFVIDLSGTVHHEEENFTTTLTIY